MANEFVVRNGLISQNNTVVTGSLNVTGSIRISGSLSISGSTQGSVLFSSSSIVSQDNSNFFWDTTNKRLGIGTSSPQASVNVSGSVAGAVRFRCDNDNAGGFADFSLFNNTSALSCQMIGTTEGTTGAAGYGRIRTGATANGLVLDAGGSKPILLQTNDVTGMQLFSTNNIVIQNGGTFTDAGFRLDVQGTTRITGATQITGSLGTTGTLAINAGTMITNGTTGGCSITTTNNRINIVAGADVRVTNLSSIGTSLVFTNGTSGNTGIKFDFNGQFAASGVASAQILKASTALSGWLIFSKLIPFS